MRFLCKLPFAVSPIIEIILQNDRRRHGVHGCFAALPRVFVSFKKPCAVIVVPRSSEKQRAARSFPQAPAPKARAFCALSPSRRPCCAARPTIDLLGAARFGKLRYTLQKALAVVLVHDLHGACEQLAFIAYGNARTRFAEVYT